MPDLKTVEKLKEGVYEWNEWRRHNPSIKPDLSNSDLRNVNLQKADLSGANLSSVNLSGANLRKVSFREAILHKSDLSEANLARVNIDQADLREANLIKANLIGAQLRGADLRRANLRECNLTEAILNGARLAETNLSRANLISAKLLAADLTQSDLRGAKLLRAKLVQANLTRVNLAEANLVRVDLSRANLTRADCSSADMTRANLRETHLSRAKLTETKLTYANFFNSDLCEANLRNARLRRTNFFKANLHEANLKGVLLGRANLRETNLSSTDLRGAELTEADLREAQLQSANLSESNLSNANLYKANLSNADLRRTQALNTTFKKSWLTGSCIQNWNINSSTIFEGTICEYVYLKSDQQDRRPREGFFAYGEFSALFQQALDTVDLIFTDGIDWQAFFQSFQQLRSQYVGQNLSVQAIEKKRGGAFIVRLEVSSDVNRAAIEASAKDLYKTQLIIIEQRYRDVLKAKEGEITAYKQQSTNLMETIRILASRPINVEATAVADNSDRRKDLRGAQFAGGYAETVQGNQEGGTINNYGSNLNDITRLIRVLRDQADIFPTEHKNDVLMELEDLEIDIQKAVPDQNRIRRRLKRLATVATTVGAITAGTATFSGNINDFTNNIVELTETLGISIEQAQSD